MLQYSLLQQSKIVIRRQDVEKYRKNLGRVSLVIQLLHAIKALQHEWSYANDRPCLQCAACCYCEMSTVVQRPRYNKAPGCTVLRPKVAFSFLRPKYVHSFSLFEVTPITLAWRVLLAEDGWNGGTYAFSNHYVKLYRHVPWYN